MHGTLASRIGLVALAVAAVIAAEPRLTLALEQHGDPRPRQFSLSGEIMGQAMGLVIRWSAAGAGSLIR